jgi:hypothetical protein
MAKIFIDANIFLGLWSSSNGRISSELLSSLIDLKSHIIITKQILDEINRNKLSVFLANAPAPLVNFPVEIPTHHSDGEDLSAINASLKSIKEDFNAVVAELKRINEKPSVEISENRDHTSKMLKPIFSSAITPTHQQLEAARSRREHGNPPGKRTDPLGDQLSWQQFLDAALGETSVWIVTRDKDYFQIINKRLFLNPFLYNELNERGIKDIFVFDNLAGAIKSIKEHGITSSITLSDDKLSQLEREENDAHRENDFFRTWLSGNWKCPNCEAMNVATTLAIHPSRHGGWSYWTKCSYCDFVVDTTETIATKSITTVFDASK